VFAAVAQQSVYYYYYYCPPPNKSSNGLVRFPRSPPPPSCWVWFPPPALVALPVVVALPAPVTLPAPVALAAVPVALAAVVWLPCCAKTGWPPFMTRSSGIAPRSTTPVAIASTDLPSLFCDPSLVVGFIGHDRPCKALNHFIIMISN
jgi:hypothetical protein